MKSKWLFSVILAIVVLVVSACGAPAVDTGVSGSAIEGDIQEDYTTPHPLLSNPSIRKAIAHCVDRDALIASVYPYVSDDVKPTLRMDTFLPKTHWAYSGPYTDYAFDPEEGSALLEQAGWTLPEGASYRVNDKGEVLAIKFTTTTAQFRQTWAAVAEQNLAECGIQLIRQHVPASWWFGDTTGLARRDFELGAFAWVGQTNPSGRTLYACSQIPLPSNNWEGQNYMGWCNDEASKAIVRANNTLDQNERIEAYDIVQQHFSEDMVSLPLFQRAEAEAWSNNLEGLIVDPTEYGTASAASWTLADGGDTIVLGFSQEPASMFSLVESSAVQRQIAQMGVGVGVSQYNYDYQPVLQTALSKIEDGLATNDEVTVTAGDIVYNVDGEPEELAAGTMVVVDGTEVEYDGTSEIQLPQLTVDYALNPYTWSDGTPGTLDDVKLAYRINCDRDSGATEFNWCDEFSNEEQAAAGEFPNITWADDGSLSWTIQYWPGVQDPTYFLMPFSVSPDAVVYPSHQVVSDGRRLADVPVAEWRTLPEIAERPLSFGPFMITDWRKGQSVTLERNPHYGGDVGVESVVVLFITDTNQAVAQLLSGDVDYVEKATLGGGAEVQTVVDAGDEGKLNVEIIPSPTWEHIDMNLFTK